MAASRLRNRPRLMAALGLRNRAIFDPCNLEACCRSSRSDRSVVSIDRLGRLGRCVWIVVCV